MSWNKRKPKKDWKGETDKLFNFLIDLDLLENQVIQFSEYHIRVLGKRKIDIWCASKKYYILGSSSSKTYELLEELKEYIV